MKPVKIIFIVVFIIPFHLLSQNLTDSFQDGVEGYDGTIDTYIDNPNLFLMLCGHRHGEGRRSDIFNENTINTLLADYQDYANGGNGFLRIMEFRPSENKIYAHPFIFQDSFNAQSESDLEITCVFEGVYEPQNAHRFVLDFVNGFA